MKEQLPNALLEARTHGDGRNGAFLMNGPLGRRLSIVASDGCDWATIGLPGGPWEHVSVKAAAPEGWMCPTWLEMVFIKELFWRDDEAVLQFHPPREDYVNIHHAVLHLWKPPYEVLLPPRECV